MYYIKDLIIFKKYTQKHDTLCKVNLWAVKEKPLPGQIEKELLLSLTHFWPRKYFIRTSTKSAPPPSSCLLDSPNQIKGRRNLGGNWNVWQIIFLSPPQHTKPIAQVSAAAKSIRQPSYPLLSFRGLWFSFSDGGGAGRWRFEAPLFGRRHDLASLMRCGCIPSRALLLTDWPSAEIGPRPAEAEAADSQSIPIKKASVSNIFVGVGTGPISGPNFIWQGGGGGSQSQCS